MSNVDLKTTEEFIVLDDSYLPEMAELYRLSFGGKGRITT